MQFAPLLGFAWRRYTQIQNLVAAGHSSDKSSHMLIDLLMANGPWLKKYFPALNDKGGMDKSLLDDATDTLKEVLLPPPQQSAQS